MKKKKSIRLFTKYQLRVSGGDRGEQRDWKV